MAPPKVKPTFNEGAPAVALGAFGDVSQSTTPAVVARAPTTKIAVATFPVPMAELLVLKPVVLVHVVPEQPDAPSYEDLATKPTMIPTPIAATPAPPVIHPASRCVSPVPVADAWSPCGGGASTAAPPLTCSTRRGVGVVGAGLPITTETRRSLSPSRSTRLLSTSPPAHSKRNVCAPGSSGTAVTPAAAGALSVDRDLHSQKVAPARIGPQVRGRHDRRDTAIEGPQPAPA